MNFILTLQDDDTYVDLTVTFTKPDDEILISGVPPVRVIFE